MALLSLMGYFQIMKTFLITFVLFFLLISKTIYSLTLDFSCKFSNAEVKFRVDSSTDKILGKSSSSDFKWKEEKKYSLFNFNQDDKEVIIKIKGYQILPKGGEKVDKIFIAYGDSPGYYQSFTFSNEHYVRGDIDCSYLGKK